MGESSSPNIMIPAAIGFVIIVTILAIAFGPSLVRHSKQARALDHGVEALATIADSIDTGTRVNYNPEMRIILDVEPDGGEPFRAETLMVVNAVDAVKYQPGKSVRVRYDPENPSVAAIVDVAN